MPRRMAFYDYANPGDRAAGALGGDVGGRRTRSCWCPACCSSPCWSAASGRASSEAGAYRFSVPLHMPRADAGGAERLWAWLALMIGLTVVNYGFPIAQLMALKETSVPAVYVGASR